MDCTQSIIEYILIHIFTLTARKRCLLEIFYLRQRYFPDPRISAEVVLVLTLSHIVLRQRKQPSKISWTSILVEHVNACTDIHDKALIQELPLKLQNKCIILIINTQRSINQYAVKINKIHELIKNYSNFLILIV